MLQVDIDQLIQRARAADARAVQKPVPTGGIQKADPRSEGVPRAATKAIRVLIADDHPVVRKGLTNCLGCTKETEVVGEAADGEELLRKVKEVTPDVVVVDVDMPKLDGLCAMEVLRREHPKVKVLVLSSHRHGEYVVRTLQSGASGFVLKDAAPEELVTAIKEVKAGQMFLSPDLARMAAQTLCNLRAEGAAPGKLSAREREVLTAIADGLSNKETATRLGVGVRTIETHRERIMRKLDIHSVAGLTRFAIVNGLIVLREEPKTRVA